MSELAEAVLAMLEKNSSSTHTAKAIASYLIAERRTSELNALLRELEERRFNTSGTLEVTATAARPLSDEIKQEIKELFKAKKTIVHEEIDKTVIGGVRVRALDKVADFSVQARLQRLRRGV